MAGRKRDEFPKRVASTLAARAGHRCSICRCPTSGPHTDSGRSVSIGVAAHITAASPKGPRYDPSLSTASRHSADNGIWACQNHGREIDRDEQGYSIEALRRLKRRAEASAHDNLGMPLRTETPTSTARDDAEVRLLERQRAALQHIVGTELKEANAILNFAVDKQRSSGLQPRARALHDALDGAAALFTRPVDVRVRDSLQGLGQWVGTWWSPSWPITQADFDRLNRCAIVIRKGLDDVERRLAPHPPLDPRVFEVLDAAAEWFGAQLEFEHLTPSGYNEISPVEILRPLEKRFDAAYLRALPVVPEALQSPLSNFRAALYATDRHAGTRPRPDLDEPGGIAERTREGNWRALRERHSALVVAARELLA